MTNLQETLLQVFTALDVPTYGTQELTVIQAQILHETIRMGGISLAQAEAAVRYVCVGDTCAKSELFDLLKEMDRRYFLMQHLRWEYSFLDTARVDVISEELARWFLQSVHGKHFSWRRWEAFVASRPVPGSGVSFSEIEVELCNLPCTADIQREDEEEKRRLSEIKVRRLAQQEKERQISEMLELDRQRRLAERRLVREALRRKQEEEEAVRLKALAEKEAEEERQRLLEEAKKHERDVQERKEREEEERTRKENEELLERLKRQAEEQNQREAAEAEIMEKAAKEAEQAEQEAEEAMRKAVEQQARAGDAESKLLAQQAELEAQRRMAQMKELKIRSNLKIGIKEQKRQKLEPAYNDFKKAKLQDHDSDLPKAEHILKRLGLQEALLAAMDKRSIPDIEASMAAVKKSGMQAELQTDMMEANELLLRLRRLERIRAEILELKQSTVAEIRSYQSPPPIVHAVMTATFLILGHKEKETKEWKTVQALVGKTGKDGLKRRCLESDPTKLAAIDMRPLERAKEIMADYELDDVRDVSAGAATFYLWASNMIEEATLITQQKEQETVKRDESEV